MRPRWRGASWPVTLLLPLLLPLAALLLVSLMRLLAHRQDLAVSQPENPVVATVLGEAVLLTPPVLPPSAFAGEGGGDYGHADRDWSKLDPDFRLVVFRLLERTGARGVQMTLVEGYRSPERQEMLAAEQVRVTHARGFESRHQYGLAVDLAPLVDGRPLVSERDGRAAAAYRVLGEEAEAMGLVWGGRWSFRDFMHVEAPGVIRENMAARVRAISAAGR